MSTTSNTTQSAAAAANPSSQQQSGQTQPPAPSSSQTQQPAQSASATTAPTTTQTSTSASTATASVSSSQQAKQIEPDKIYQWINELCMPATRENALIELSRQREAVQDLAPMLWYSFGAIAALLQEVISVYPAINPPNLTAHQSNRVCNSLALLQCVASHHETRSLFLQAHIPIFLYPFLHTTLSKTRPFEYLRLTSLGVIGALVKTDEQDVITFLLSTEIIPLCLKIMEQGSELSKTVATFILQKILTDDTGLAYICQTYERFSHVAKVLGLMVINLAKEPSSRLLKHVVRCYLRLSDNARAKEALRSCLPDQLKDQTFADCLKEDASTKKWLAQLIKNLEPFVTPTAPNAQSQATGGVPPANAATPTPPF